MSKKNMQPLLLPVRTGYNPFNYTPQEQTQFAPTLTVPDQTLSMREIMHRYSRGLPIEPGRIGTYDNEDLDAPFYPDLEKLDYAVREHYIAQAQAELRELRVKTRNEKKQKETEFLQKTKKSENGQNEPSAGIAAAAADGADAGDQAQSTK